MNPEEHHDPYQTLPQPNMPGATPQPGGFQPTFQPTMPPQNQQPGAFVSEPGTGTPYPETQPQPHQPYPAQQHPAYSHAPASQPPVAPHNPQHNPYGQWQQQPAHAVPHQNPYQNSTPSAQNKKLVAIIITAIVVLLVGVGVFFLMKGDNPVSNLTNSITGNSDVVDRSDGTLDLSPLIDPIETIKSQDIKAKLNQQINLSDGSSYMVTNVERNWTHAEVKASNGKELIKVSVVVGNKSKEGNIYFSDNFFRLKNSAGGLQDAEYVSADEVPDALVGGEVAPGKQLKGVIIYEVDKDEKLGGMTTEDKYTKSGSDDEIVVKSEVAF